MPCQNYEPRVLIGEYGASDGIWYIGVELFHVNEYEVQEAKYTPEGVVILATDVNNEEEVEITLMEDEEGIFKMGGITFSEGEYLIYKEAMSNYPTRICTDVETIMDMLAHAWIPLQEREDGSFYIFEECMYGSGSIDIDEDGSMLSFSGGGDQMSYDITGMNMTGGVVNIAYFNNESGEEDTLSIYNLLDIKSAITSKSGWFTSEYFVPEHLVDEFEVVAEEPCDDY